MIWPAGISKPKCHDHHGGITLFTNIRVIIMPACDASWDSDSEPAAAAAADPAREFVASKSDSATAGSALWPDRPARGPLRSSH